MAAAHSIQLTQALVQELFDYSPESGELRWRKAPRSNHAKAGDIAGSTNALGYRQVHIGRRGFLVHRVAWLYVHGWLPTVIDHINRNKADNRLCNLRAADKRLNAFNAKMLSTNKSGYRGVSLDRLGKWVARINTGTEYKYLGRFDTPELAHEAYMRKAREIAGEFVADTYV